MPAATRKLSSAQRIAWLDSCSEADLRAAIQALPPEDLAEAQELIARAFPPSTEASYSPQTATERQQAFLALDCREALYGGAAGGGKSSALLMAALQHVDQPGYRALLLRRTYADLSLPGALMDRAREWLGASGARWVDREHSWVFPSGASVTFGYLDTANDRFRYQGAELQFVGFDELTQFREEDYRYLFSRLRRLEGSAVPLRMRAASNPGGIGHEWVRLRFGIGTAEDGTPLEPPDGRVFIPAKLSDNPYLDQETYAASLAELDPITRRQLLAGDWTARSTTGFFKRESFTIREARPAEMRWVRFWDCAAKTTQSADYTAGALVGRHQDGRGCIGHMVRRRVEYPDARKLILQQAALDGTDVTIGIEDTSSGIALLQDLRRSPEATRYTFRPVKVTTDKQVRAGPWASVTEGGLMSLVSGAWATAFLDECEGFPVGHDDQIDAVSGAWGMLAGKGGYTPLFGAFTRQTG